MTDDPDLSATASAPAVTGNLTSLHHRSAVFAVCNSLDVELDVDLVDGSPDSARVGAGIGAPRR